MLVVPRRGRSSCPTLFQHPVRRSIAHVVLKNLPNHNVDHLELVRRAGWHHRKTDPIRLQECLHFVRSIFDKGQPIKNVENDCKVTICDRAYPVKKDEGLLKVWGATDPPK